jgi:hypothetical protein
MLIPRSYDALRRRIVRAKTGAGQQFAEVGISRDQDPVLLLGKCHHLVVRPSPQAQVIHMRAVMTFRPQQTSHARGEALIQQEPHAVRRTGSSRSSTARAA